MEKITDEMVKQYVKEVFHGREGMANEFMKGWDVFKSRYGNAGLDAWEIVELNDGSPFNIVINSRTKEKEYYLTNISVVLSGKACSEANLIKSVRRLSDGTIFNIGDECYDLSLKGTIKRIYANNIGQCIIECSNKHTSGNDWIRIISQINHL